MAIKKIINKAVSLYQCNYKNTQKFFVATKNDIDEFALSSRRNFYDVDNEKDFRDLCKKYNFDAGIKNTENLFKNNSHFCMLSEGNHYGCWGWYTDNSDNFYILEINKRISVQGVCMLYNFYTNKDYRRRGYYTDLLKSIVASSKSEYCCIYAFDTNIPSTAAIEKCGFKYVGSFNHRNFKSISHLIKLYKKQKNEIH